MGWTTLKFIWLLFQIFLDETTIFLIFLNNHFFGSIIDRGIFLDNFRGFDFYPKALDLKTNYRFCIGFIELFLLEKLPPVLHLLGRIYKVILRIRVALAAVSITIEFTLLIRFQIVIVTLDNWIAIYWLVHHEHWGPLFSLLNQRSVKMTLHHCLFFQVRSFFLTISIQSFKLFYIGGCLQNLQIFDDSLGSSLWGCWFLWWCRLVIVLK